MKFHGSDGASLYEPTFQDEGIPEPVVGRLGIRSLLDAERW